MYIAPSSNATCILNKILYCTEIIRVENTHILNFRYLEAIWHDGTNIFGDLAKNCTYLSNKLLHTDVKVKNSQVLRPREGMDRTGQTDACRVRKSKDPTVHKDFAVRQHREILDV